MNQNVFIRRACMSLMFSMLCLLSLAQTHQVSGIVKDVTGEPVIGVNVSVQGLSLIHISEPTRRS